MSTPEKDQWDEQAEVMLPCQWSVLGCDAEHHYACPAIKRSAVAAELRKMKKSELPKISERVFTKQVCDLARWSGWLVFHPLTAMNKAGRYATFTQGDVGYPDLTMTRDGRLIFAELKAENGVTSAMQDEWLRRLRSCEAMTTPVRVYLWRPSDWDEIEKVLK